MTAAPLPTPLLAYRAETKRVNPWLIAVVVSIATFMEVLDTSIANVALAHIAGNLGASQDESTWVLTSYLVSNAIIMPLSGWLSSVFGRKRFYMSCVAIFTISSFLCGFAPSLGWLLFFRVLQGVGGGGLAPSEQAILADTFEPRQRGMAFALYGLSVVVAPAIGPTIGGWITDNYNWRWIFYINVPFGILSLFLTNWLVTDSANAKRETAALWKKGLNIDYIGFGLVTLGLGALQIVLDKGQEDDWFGSKFILILAIIAGIGLVSAVVWELVFAKDPVVDLSLLKNRSFLFSNILMFIMGFILNTTTALFPQFTQEVLGYDATTAGLTLMAGGFTLMLMMPFAGIAASRFQPKYLVALGITGTAMAMYHMTSWSSTSSFSAIAWSRVFQCISLPFFFIPINTLAYLDLPPGKSNAASALLNLFRNLGGAVGISIATTLLTRREQFHQDRLSAYATPFNEIFRRDLKSTAAIFGTGQHAKDQALSALYSGIQEQAAVLSYIDVFWLVSLFCIPAIILVLFVRNVKRGEKVEAAAH
jgi:DHA2 family multidrug resistance protein